MPTLASNSALLAPVMVLVLWSLVMWVWLYATRIPAMQKAGVELDNTKTPGELGASMPPKSRWPADNYNHLMEQPTIFYATAIVAALAGLGDGLVLYCAWGYVGLRIVHSLIQATVNIIMVRFMVFSVSSIVLAVMAIKTALAVL